MDILWNYSNHPFLQAFWVKTGSLAQVVVIEPVCSTKQLAGLQTARNEGIRTRYTNMCLVEM